MPRSKYSCDFETTTNPDDCRVWAYGWMEVGKKSNYKIGTSLDEFMEWCSKVQADLYFHNLKFDGSFIINWLFKNGYEFDEAGKAKTFKATISSTGQWYMIDICYGYKGKYKLHTTIYDSLKKLPFKVADIANAFGLEMKKGDIDYHKERPIGYEITEDEREYIYNDIAIIAEALNIQFKQGQVKMTNGSDSLTEFKSLLTSKMFEKYFPVFTLEMDKEMRRAYRGGFTWLNKKYRSVEIGEGRVFDVNSLYPAIMYERDLPYGNPIFFEGKYEYDEQFPLFIIHIRCEFYLKKDHIPTIQIKGSRFKETEYLESSGGEPTDLYLTSVDWELIQEHYEVYDVEYIDGWKFRSAKGLFKSFIDKWTAIKIMSEGAIRLLAKLMLNALYGKFATNPDVTGKIPYLKEDGQNGFRLGDENFRDPIYTPMGAFITAWSRHLTITTAQKCYNRIIYCDTDSIHITGTTIPDAIRDIVDDNKLGYWKAESIFKRGKYIRQKTYVHDDYVKPKKDKNGNIVKDKEGNIKFVECSPEEATGTKLTVKCAGMPDRIKEFVTFDNFKVGFTSYGKLLPKQVSGGVVLIDTEFTIK